MENSDIAYELKKEAERLLATEWSGYVSLISSREIQVVIRKHAMNIGYFHISVFPGNSSILIFHGVEIMPAYQGLGLGGRLHDLRLAIAKAVGARLVMCTVVAGNEPQEAILRKRDWHSSQVHAGRWRTWVKVIQQEA